MKYLRKLLAWLNFYNRGYTKGVKDNQSYGGGKYSE